MKTLDVVAVGHALVDVRIVVDRIPGPDEEAEIREEVHGAGGSAVNVSIDVARLGGRSGIVAKIGFDSFGRIVYEELWNARVDIRGLRISPLGPTGFSIVAISKGGEIAIMSSKGVAEELMPEEIDREVIQAARTVHIASLRLDTSLTVARKAREAGALVSWDPGRRLARLGLDKLAEILENTDIVFLNRNEAKTMTGLEPEDAAKAISGKGPRHVIVKLGAHGALLYSQGKYHRIPPIKPPRVRDTTGAGDAFAAATLLMLSRGQNIVTATRYASAVAALKVAFLGSHAMPSLDEINSFTSRTVGIP